MSPITAMTISERLLKGRNNYLLNFLKIISATYARLRISHLYWLSHTLLYA